MDEERRAFEAMMAEVEDSDSEDDAKSSHDNRGNVGHAESSRAESKSSSRVTTASKLSKHDQEIENFGERGSRGNAARSSLVDTSPVSRNWLMRPCAPGDPPMLCYVERFKPTLGALGGGVIYRAYLELGDKSRSRFLMSAKKLLNKRTSYYLVSTEQEPGDDRGSDDLLGKVRSNAIGSRYMLTDHGIAPSKCSVPSSLRKELGLVKFEFDSEGPSQVIAWVPSVNSSGIPSTWQPDSEDGSIEAHVEKENTNGLLLLRNKRPKWDEAHGGHVLNFQGRVTESSVKNFQLVCNSVSGDDVVLQFGRTAKHRFSMDVRYPLSPFQAFGMCVACMDGKIADRKGYEYVRKMADNASESVAKITSYRRDRDAEFRK